MLWTVAACAILALAYRTYWQPGLSVEEVEAWLAKLPANATSADVKKLFAAKGIEFENHYPPDPPDHPNGRMHGVIPYVNWRGSDVDVMVHIDANDRVVKVEVSKGWRGP